MKNGLLILIIIFLQSCGIYAHSSGSETSKTIVLNPSSSIFNQIKISKRTYIIKDKFDLSGRKLVIPKNCILTIEGGAIVNGTIEFNNTQIVAEPTPVFIDINETLGTISNNEISVEWFNCKPGNDGSVNQLSLNILVPLALRSKSNIFFASKGEYKVRAHFPVIRNMDNTSILDCHGITIHGCGEETIIRNVGCWYEGMYHVEDVFNIVNCKNLNISDLSVTADKYYSSPRFDENGNPMYPGTNAFSLINFIENISIQNCKAYNMPTVWYYFSNIDYFYPDGGKGFTIQHENGDELRNKGVHNVRFDNCTVENCASAFDVVISKNVKCENVSWSNCMAKECSYGVYIVNTKANDTADISFSKLHVEDCQIGVYGYIPIGLQISDSYFFSNSNERKYPEHLTDNYFIQLLSAYNCTLSNNHFVKGKDVTMYNALLLGQCGSSDIYTTEKVQLIDNSFTGSFDGSVIKFSNPAKTNAIRFKNITTRNNSITGSHKGRIVEVPNKIDRTFIYD